MILLENSNIGNGYLLRLVEYQTRQITLEFVRTQYYINTFWLKYIHIYLT